MEATSLVPYDPASGRPGTRLEGDDLLPGRAATIPGSGEAAGGGRRDQRVHWMAWASPPELTTEAVGRLPAGPQP